jgi:hypothetical protein
MARCLLKAKSLLGWL